MYIVSESRMQRLITFFFNLNFQFVFKHNYLRYHCRFKSICKLDLKFKRFLTTPRHLCTQEKDVYNLLQRQEENIPQKLQKNNFEEKSVLRAFNTLVSSSLRLFLLHHILQHSATTTTRTQHIIVHNLVVYIFQFMYIQYMQTIRRYRV